MKTYSIVKETNPYLAQRDGMGRKTKITLEKGLTLKEAQKELLRMFNKDCKTNYPNWGLAVATSSKLGEAGEASPSRPDGTRFYEYDSRYYSIEEVEGDSNELPTVYTVNDTETGNGTIYVGTSIEVAIEAILEDDDPEMWDLYRDEERIWCGQVNTIAELKEINSNED